MSNSRAVDALPTGSLGAELQKVLGEKRKHASVTDLGSSGTTLASLNVSTKKTKPITTELDVPVPQLAGEPSVVSSNGKVSINEEANMKKLTLYGNISEETASGQQQDANIKKVTSFSVCCMILFE